MKTVDRYHKWVEWSDEDGVYIGRCPDLITGIHGDDPVQVYKELCEVIADVIDDLHARKQPLPSPRVPNPSRVEAEEDTTARDGRAAEKQIAARGPAGSRWIQKQRDTGRINWVVGVVVPIVVAIGSAMASWQIASQTTMTTLGTELDKGTTVFKNIGQRYFAAIYGLYEPSDDGSYKPSQDTGTWTAYRKILADISDDLNWLLTNPVYSDEHADMVPHIQNFLVEESVSTVQTPSSKTLRAMCVLYLDNGLWSVPDQATPNELYVFADRLCEQQRT